MTYGSTQDRLSWINSKLAGFSGMLQRLNLTEEQLPIAASALIERLKIFALFTKHRGFREENEWRIVHLKQYDRQAKLEKMLGYFIGKRGIEPKLKFKVAPIEGFTADDMSLQKLVHQIIVGPSVSNVLTYKALERLLDQSGKRDLIPRLRATSTPYRPI